MSCAQEQAKLQEAEFKAAQAEWRWKDAETAYHAAVDRVGSVCHDAHTCHPERMAECSAAIARAEAAEAALAAASAAWDEASGEVGDAQQKYNGCVQNCPAWVWILNSLL